MDCHSRQPSTEKVRRWVRGAVTQQPHWEAFVAECYRRVAMGDLEDGKRPAEAERARLDRIAIGDVKVVRAALRNSATAVSDAMVTAAMRLIES